MFKLCTMAVTEISRIWETLKKILIKFKRKWERSDLEMTFGFGVIQAEILTVWFSVVFSLCSVHIYSPHKQQLPLRHSVFCFKINFFSLWQISAELTLLAWSYFTYLPPHFYSLSRHGHMSGLMAQSMPGWPPSRFPTASNLLFAPSHPPASLPKAGLFTAHDHADQ